MISKGYNPFWEKTMGDLSFYIARGGKLIGRQKHSKVSKNGTLTREMMLLRILITNLVIVWRNLLPVLHYTFYNKARKESDYNAFVSMNKKLASVCLTKTQVEQGACVIEPFYVSRGSLPHPVRLELRGGMWVSDIFLGDLEIGDSTTIAQFSKAVIDHNEDYHENTVLRFLRVYQLSGDDPSVKYYSFAVVLNTQDYRLLRQQDGTDGFLSTAGSAGQSEYVEKQGNFLSAKNLKDSLLCYIRGEYVDGEHLNCTVQKLEGSNSLVEDYCSTEAQDKAITSYGGTRRRNSMDPHTKEKSWREQYGDGQKPEEAKPDGGGNGSTGSSPAPTPVKVTISCVITGENASRGSVSPESVTVDQGSQVTFTATVDTGYKPKWPNNSNALTYTVTADESKNIALQFIADSGLSVKEGEEE